MRIIWTLKRILRAIIEDFKSKVSSVAHSVYAYSLLTNAGSWNIIFRPPLRRYWYFSPEEHYSVFFFRLPKAWKTLQWRRYSVIKRWRHYRVFIFYYVWRNDLRLYNRMILERNDLRLYDRMILAINVNLLGYCCHLRTLDFDLPPSGVICALHFASLSGGKSKSACLKWQQCPQNEHYCLVFTKWSNTS